MDSVHAKELFKPTWSPQISMGNVLTIVGGIFVTASMWTSLNRDVDDGKTKDKDLSARLILVENSINTINDNSRRLGVIEARVDRIDDSGTHASQRRNDEEAARIVSLERTQAAVEVRVVAQETKMADVLGTMKAIQVSVDYIAKEIANNKNPK